MSRFFKPYEGNRPFIFVSYPHNASAEVIDTIRILHDKGYRVWYDEGIPAGSDWPANIADHMKSCEAVLFFVNEKALASPNCRSEMMTAERLGKQILLIALEETQPDESWNCIFEDRFLLPSAPDPASRAEGILKTGFVKKRYRKKPLEDFNAAGLALAISILLFAGSAAAFAALVTGRWQPFADTAIVPDPLPSSAPSVPADAPEVVIPSGNEWIFAVRFPDTEQEKAIRAALDIPDDNIYKWQLAEIDSLCFYGNLTFEAPAELRFDESGNCRVNGAPVIQGKLSDLSLFENMLRIESLELVCQPLGDLSPLSGKELLRTLSLAGSTVSSLNGLSDLPRLERLDVAHTSVKDLSPLLSLASLKTVTVSPEMLPLSWPADAQFEVVLSIDR